MYTRGKRNPNDQPKEEREKKKKKKKKKKKLSLSLSLREHGDLRLSLSLSLYLSDTKRRYADALFFPHKKWRKVGKKSNTKRKKSTRYDVGKKRRSADVVDRRWCRDSSREVLVFFALFDQREVFFSSLFSSERCFFIIFFW